MGTRGELFSAKSISPKRSYFFNVKENRHGDIFLNIVESKKNAGNDNFERFSLLVYEDDLEDFVDGFEQAVKFIRGKRR